MTFAMGETIEGVSHLLTRWQRSFLRQPTTRHLDKFAARGIAVTAAADADGVPKTCTICGFAIARIELADGWSLETCSAVGLGKLAGNCRLEPWARRLSAAATSAETSTVSPDNDRSEADSTLTPASGLPAKLV